MSEQNYYWTSTGGDELCDAMAGVHIGYEPARPHPNCVCTVSAIGTETGQVENRSESSCSNIYSELIDINFLTAHEYTDEGSVIWEEIPPRFEVIASYQIDCIDHEGNVTHGETIEKTGEIEMDVDADGYVNDLIGDAEAWVYDQMFDVELEAEGLCPSCQGPSLV